MKSRTRGEGKGVKNGRVAKLKPLAESTIRGRKSAKIHSETTPETSNLTMTGALLDHVVYKGKANRQGIELTITISRNDLDKIAGYLADQGRSFLELSSGEMTKVDKELNRIIRDLQRNIR